MSGTGVVRARRGHLFPLWRSYEMKGGAACESAGGGAHAQRAARSAHTVYTTSRRHPPRPQFSCASSPDFCGGGVEGKYFAQCPSVDTVVSMAFP
eukprot:gene7408-biopygen21046